MSRKRLFWGNIPGMSRLAKDRLDEMDVGKNIELQGVLDEKLDRVAQVNKTRTITTNKNSLTRSSGGSQVLMKGEKSNISVQEMEKLFGLPEHYTDVQNLTPTIRQKLLGKSWSVQVIYELLTPLSSLTHRASTCINEHVVDDSIVLSDTSDEKDNQLDESMAEESILCSDTSDEKANQLGESMAEESILCSDTSDEKDNQLDESMAEEPIVCTRENVKTSRKRAAFRKIQTNRLKRYIVRKSKLLFLEKNY